MFWNILHVRIFYISCCVVPVVSLCIIVYLILEVLPLRKLLHAQHHTVIASSYRSWLLDYRQYITLSNIQSCPRVYQGWANTWLWWNNRWDKTFKGSWQFRSSYRTNWLNYYCRAPQPPDSEYQLPVVRIYYLYARFHSFHSWVSVVELFICRKIQQQCSATMRFMCPQRYCYYRMLEY